MVLEEITKKISVCFLLALLKIDEAPQNLKLSHLFLTVYGTNILQHTVFVACPCICKMLSKVRSCSTHQTSKTLYGDRTVKKGAEPSSALRAEFSLKAFCFSYFYRSCPSCFCVHITMYLFKKKNNVGRGGGGLSTRTIAVKNFKQRVPIWTL